MESDISDDPREGLPPETDYDRQEGRDDLYGNDLEYDIVFDQFGNISKPAPIDGPSEPEPE